MKTTKLPTSLGRRQPIKDSTNSSNDDFFYYNSSVISKRERPDVEDLLSPDGKVEIYYLQDVHIEMRVNFSQD
jgi:hypothetical protein